jgi:antirestriction protein ArdC
MAAAAAHLSQRAASVARQRTPRFRGSDVQEGTLVSKTIGKESIYREITDTIIAELDRGIVSWVQPWTNSSFPPYTWFACYWDWSKDSQAVTGISVISSMNTRFLHCNIELCDAS